MYSGRSSDLGISNITDIPISQKRENSEKWHKGHIFEYNKFQNLVFFN